MEDVVNTEQMNQQVADAERQWEMDVDEIFANPVPDGAPSRPLGPDLSDAPDDVRMNALFSAAFAPASEMNPAFVMGPDRWSQMVATDDDPVETFDYEWDWNMTPAQKADAVSFRMFDDDMRSLVDEYSDALVRMPVDPKAYAEQVTMNRTTGGF